MAWITIAGGILGGLFAGPYAWSHYQRLPDRIPTHFGLSGVPDAWSPKALGTVLVLPVLALASGVIQGSLALFIVTAKLPVHGLGDTDQQRLRRLAANYLCILGSLMVSMLTVGTVSSIRVALGEADRLDPLFLALLAAFVLYAFAGAIHLVRVQIQSSRDRIQSTQTAPELEERHWRWKLFYFNPRDPAILVEKRFGIGWTINFGNPLGLALTIVIVATLVAILLR